MVWPIASKIIFEQKGIKESSMHYPANIAPLDSTKSNIWQVTAIDQNGEVIAQSLVGVIPPAPPGPIPCEGCRVHFLTPNPAPAFNLSMCIGQVLPTVYTSNLWLPCNAPCVPNTITSTWTLVTAPNLPVTTVASTPGVYTYNFIQTKLGCPGTVPSVCSRKVTINVVSSTIPFVDVCGDANNSYTECCGVIKFNLRKIPNPLTTSCNAINNNYFPVGTVYRWYIMKTANSLDLTQTPSSVAIPPVSFQSTCWVPQVSNPPSPAPPTVTIASNGIWYPFGTNSVSVTAPGNTFVSDLSATTGGEQYYVTCVIEFPSGSLLAAQGCFPNGLKTTPFPFSIAPNPNAIQATVTPTLANCDKNGELEVNVTSQGQYKYRIPQTTAFAPFTLPFPVSIGGLSAIVSGGSSYQLIIQDKMLGHCATKVYTGPFGWGPRPKVTITTSPLNQHLIPCSGNLLLNAVPAVPPFPATPAVDASFNCLITQNTYEWMWCPPTTINTNDPTVWITIGRGATYNTGSPNYEGGYYKVKVTAHAAPGSTCVGDGACRESAIYTVTSNNPPQPTISGPVSVCDTVHTIILSATGTNLTWSLGTTQLGQGTLTSTGSTFTITNSNYPGVNPNLPQTYTVTSTNPTTGCSSSQTITITGHQCCSCNYTISRTNSPIAAFGQQNPVIAVPLGGNLYKATVYVQNYSTSCTGIIKLESAPNAQLLLPSQTYSVPIGGPTPLIFQFTSSQPSGSVFAFPERLTLSNQLPGAVPACKSYVHVKIP